MLHPYFCYLTLMLCCFYLMVHTSMFAHKHAVHKLQLDRFDTNILLIKQLLKQFFKHVCFKVFNLQKNN